VRGEEPTLLLRRATRRIGLLACAWGCAVMQRLFGKLAPKK
jgi:hypothetical protein